MMEGLPLVKIGWSDAIENLDGWHSEKEAVEWAEEDDWIVHQVGWILKETDEYILFTNRYNSPSAGREGTYGGLFKIPKPWIKYRKILIQQCQNKEMKEQRE